CPRPSPGTTGSTPTCCVPWGCPGPPRWAADPCRPRGPTRCHRLFPADLDVAGVPERSGTPATSRSSPWGARSPAVVSEVAAVDGLGGVRPVAQLPVDRQHRGVPGVVVGVGDGEPALAGAVQGRGLRVCGDAAAAVRAHGAGDRVLEGLRAVGEDRGDADRLPAGDRDEGELVVETGVLPYGLQPVPV